MALPGEKPNARHWACLLAAVVLTACEGGDASFTAPATSGQVPTPTRTAYSGRVLVSDGSLAAATADRNLINPWGIAFAPDSPVWIANNATGTATLYDGRGLKDPRVVALPAGMNGAANPSGVVFNGTTDFRVSNGTQSAAASFIFDGEGGTLIAWAPTVDPANGIIVYDDGGGGAVYTGLAIAADRGANFLYATDFRNNKIDVFDRDFTKVAAAAGAFTDPSLAAGFAPFGIGAVTTGGETVLIVTYAQRAPGSNAAVNGPGLGLVNVFDTSGALLRHLVPVGGNLNAPWGIALAPAGFGSLSNTLLIGNFGDGVINAYDPATGAWVESIRDSAGQQIATPGLWGIAFGNGARNQPVTTLFFAAGVANEAAGVYGRIDLADSGSFSPSPGGGSPDGSPADSVPPTVSLSSPASNSMVSGIITVAATATDNLGVVSVEFFAGPFSIGVATPPFFAINWNSATVANGRVTLSARARDAAGNVATSAPIVVDVSNLPPPQP
jgi:uncharacterized protein (TIGR03118 family)